MFVYVSDFVLEAGEEESLAYTAHKSRPTYEICHVYNVT